MQAAAAKMKAAAAKAAEIEVEAAAVKVEAKAAEIDVEAAGVKLEAVVVKLAAVAAAATKQKDTAAALTTAKSGRHLISNRRRGRENAVVMKHSKLQWDQSFKIDAAVVKMPSLLNT